MTIKDELTKWEIDALQEMFNSEWWKVFIWEVEKLELDFSKKIRKLNFDMENKEEVKEVVKIKTVLDTIDTIIKAAQRPIKKWILSKYNDNLRKKESI